MGFVSSYVPSVLYHYMMELLSENTASERGICGFFVCCNFS